MEKSNIDPVDEIYAVAQQDAKEELEKVNSEVEAIRDESFALGILKKIQYDNANNDLLQHAVLFRVKKSKEYKQGGMTWKQFCESMGLNVRNVDRALKDISPLVEQFSDKMSDLSGVNFNKIRYLGRSISDNLSEISAEGIVVSEDVVIPVAAEHKEDIEAYIDELKVARQEAEQEKKEELKAKERVIKSLHKTIETQGDDLARYGLQPKAGELSEVEKDQLKLIKGLKAQFDLFYGAAQPEVNFFLYTANKVLKAEYGNLIAHAMKLVEDLRDLAHEELEISIFPEGGAVAEWMPPEGDEWTPPDILSETNDSAE